MQNSAKLPEGIDVALIDLNKEAVLDPSIYSDGERVDLEAEPKNILLTGATGFLGAYLLRDLLEETQADIHCIVRCSDGDEGRLKLRKNLEKYGLWNDLFDLRIVIHPGDLSKPLLGLSKEEFRSLAAAMDAIYHSGASVSLLKSYHRLKDANVLGTQEIIRLACLEKMKPLHHVSSVAVFKSAGSSGHSTFREDTNLNRWKATVQGSDGYAQSKWVAERLVMLARSRGLPATIYRPGSVTGDSVTGSWNTNDFICSLITASILLQCAPYTEASVDLTPVDFVSKAIVYLSRRKESFHRIYHLNNPKPITFMNLIRSISSLGYPLRFVWQDDWQQMLFDLLETSEGIAYSNFLPVLERVSRTDSKISVENATLRHLRDSPPQPDDTTDKEGKLSFECRSTCDALAGTSIACPPADKQLLSTYLSYLVQCGRIDEPKLGVMRSKKADGVN